ncbi:MAG: AAA family ATPase [Hydrogenophaga sp.]|uniref:AAA family ATPase n=1 Tax=Hydrogenophaga sp. TaxID=1904254 RepID=UPI002611171D|nr:AAA family ATPase [Hydrogenophaga sp.]MDM7943385.1 AAA family ATPase [Hydrogenophaga sp.]
MTILQETVRYAPLAKAGSTAAPGSGIQISNEQFLLDVFGDEYMLAHVTAFTESPDTLDPHSRKQSARCWAGGWYSDKARALVARSNTYFTISLFEPSVEDGIKKARRRKALHRVTCCIVVDDVGTKVPRDVVTLPPSWRLETSPGNCQVGYIISGGGEADQVLVEGLVNAMVAKGLAVEGKDPGMKGVTRYVRLPVGSNRKSAYLERFGADGYLCQMLEYVPERKYTIAQIAEAFGISADDISKHTDCDGAKPARHDAVVGGDPVLDAFAAIGAYKHALSDGWHDVTCCKVYEHTDSADNGAAVRLNSDGSYGYRCHHRHGGELKFPQVLEWFEREHPELGLSAAVPSRSSPAGAAEFEDLEAVDRDKRDYILGMIEMAESEGVAATDLIEMVKAELPALHHAQAMVDSVLKRLSGKTGGTPEKLAEDLGVEVKTDRHPVALDWSRMPEDPPEIPFVIPGWMPDKVVTMFAAHGGTGKSYMSVYIALCLATGRHPFDPDQKIPRTRVVLYSAEDNLDVMHLRFARYMRKLKIARSDLEGWLHVLDATESDNVLFAGEEKVNGRTTERFKWLAKEVKRIDAKVLIFDNASDAIDANENDRAKVRQFMSHLKRLASAVLLLSHVDAASSMAEVGEAKGYSGSTGWHNSARSRWFMARVKDSDEIVLTLPKVNYAKAGAEAVIKWNDGLKLFDVVTVRQGRARAEDHRDMLLNLLDQAIKQGRRVSPKQNSSNSVFNTLKSMEGMPAGLKSADVMKEVNRWLGEGFVKVDTYLMSNRNAGECLALTEKGHETAAGVFTPEGEL